jgi:hypothetical protein
METPATRGTSWQRWQHYGCVLASIASAGVMSPGTCESDGTWPPGHGNSYAGGRNYLHLPVVMAANPIFSSYHITLMRN